MDSDKQKALEAAGWKFGSVHEFLGEQPMSDSDKMRAEFETYAEQRNWNTRQYHGSYYWAEAARAWQVWQAAYAAGRKAEQETIRKLISPEVVAPLIKLSELVDGSFKRSKKEGER